MCTPSPARLLIVTVGLLMTGPASAQIELETSVGGGSSRQGNMFDIVATNTVTVRGFHLNLQRGIHDIEIYAVNGGGTHIGKELNPVQWKLIGATSGVISKGLGKETPVPIALNETITAGSTLGFYITATNGFGLTDTTGVGTGTPFVSDVNVTINEGVGNVYPFGATTPARIWNGVLLYDTGPADVSDVAVIGISSPVSPSDGCSGLSAGEVVTAELQNLGTLTVPPGTNLALTVSTGGPPIVEIFNLPMALSQYDKTTLAFATTVDLSFPGTYEVQVISTSVDDDTSNNTFTSTIQSGARLVSPTSPYYEDFDDHGATNGSTLAPPGWTQSVVDNPGPNGDWVFRHDSTPSANTGPNEDNSTCEPEEGGYMHFEDSGSEHPIIEISSPCLSLQPATQYLCEFWVHSNNANQPASENFFSLDVLDVMTATLQTDVIGPVGHIGNQWTRVEVDLSSFAGLVIQLIFRGRTDNGGAFGHDIAVDDVIVRAFTAGPGQAPQTGFAEFDINDARNEAGNAVPSFEPGPYFTQVPSGSPATFTFRGDPNQPIILFTGPLNPGALSVGPVGQLDVGSPDGMGGVTNIVIVADGASPCCFLNLLFFTNSAGTMTFTAGIPHLFAGMTFAFQSVIFGGPFGVSISNAVVMAVANVTILSVLPPLAAENETFKIIGTGFDPANTCIFAGDMAAGEVLEDSTSTRLNVRLGPVWMQQEGPVRIMEGTVTTDTGAKHTTVAGSDTVASGGKGADGVFDVMINSDAKEVAGSKEPPFIARKSSGNTVYRGTANGTKMDFAITGDAPKKARAAVTLCLFDGVDCYTIVSFRIRFSASAATVTNEQIAEHVAFHIDSLTGIDATSNASGDISITYSNSDPVSHTTIVTSTIRIE